MRKWGKEMKWHRWAFRTVHRTLLGHPSLMKVSLSERVRNQFRSSGSPFYIMKKKLFFVVHAANWVAEMTSFLCYNSKTNILISQKHSRNDVLQFHGVLAVYSILSVPFITLIYLCVTDKQADGPTDGRAHDSLNFPRLLFFFLLFFALIRMRKKASSQFAPKS